MASLHKLPLSNVLPSDLMQDWYNKYNELVAFVNDHRYLEPSVTETNLKVTLNAGWIQTPSGILEFPETEVDLSSYIPQNEDKYVLITVDVDGNVVVVDGNESASPVIPSAEGLSVICIVLLSPGMTAITKDKVQDVRSIISFSGSGSGGGGSVEAVKYYQLLESEPFENLFFDNFENDDFIDLSESSAGINLEKTAGKSQITFLNTNDYLITKNLIPEGLDKIKVILDGLDLTNFKVEFSNDNKNTWNEISQETLINTTATDNFYLKITSLIDNNVLYSYGILYNFIGYDYYSKGKLYEVYEATTDISAGSVITIPNGKTYTVNGVSLVVHKLASDGKTYRLVSGIDYDENDETSIKINFMLLTGEKLIFEQYYGLVSDEAENLINSHDNNINAHPSILNTMKKGGLFVISSDIKGVGQNFDEIGTIDNTVENLNVVYKGADGTYYKAIADGTEKSQAVGICIDDGIKKRIVTSGIIEIDGSGFSVGDTLYLSDLTPGAIVNIETPIKLGKYLGNNYLLLDIEYSGMIKLLLSDYIIGEYENKMVYTNEGATADLTITLPEPNKGNEFEFLIMSAHNIIISVADTGTQVIRKMDLSEVTSISSNTVGSYLKIKCLENNKWDVIFEKGTWN